MSVLDASVILKWFVNEVDSDRALKLREEFFAGEREIVVPDLLLYEVGNALLYNATFATDEIQEALNTLFGMEIEIITPTSALLAKTIELARSLNVTCYDATYIALAEELEFEFVTADERFYRKVEKNTNLKVPVRLLSDFSIGH